MKQHVDLYQHPFRRGETLLASRTLFSAVAVALGLLLVVVAFGHWQLRRLAHEVATLRAQEFEASERLEALRLSHPPARPDAALAAEEQALQGDRKAKARLLAWLADDQLDAQQGFASHVAGLARRRVDGLWLRRVRIGDGGRDVTLEGSAVEPGLVPRLLHELGDEESFAGRSFETLRIERSQPDAFFVDFVLGTREEPEP